MMFFNVFVRQHRLKGRRRRRRRKKRRI